MKPAQAKTTKWAFARPDLVHALSRLLVGVAAGSLFWGIAGLAQAGRDNSCLHPVQGTESAMQEVCAYSEGLAAFKIKDLWGYLDLQGQVRIAPQFKQALAFSQGLASVQELKAGGNEDCDCEHGSQGGRWGYIDSNGQWVVAPQFLDAAPFSQGLAAVSLPVDGRQNMSFIDRQGQLAMTARFYWAEAFVGDRALVNPTEDSQAFVTRRGQILALPGPAPGLPAGTQVRITEGRAQPERWLAVLKAPQRLISANGRTLPLTSQQRFERSVSPTAAIVVDDKNHWGTGLMHESGRWLLPPEFSSLGKFERGVSVAMREAAAPPSTPASPSVFGSGRDYFLVSVEGKLLTPAYEKIERKRGFFVAKLGDEQFLLGARGERLTKLSCQSDPYYAAQAVHDDDGWSVVNTCDDRHWVQSAEGRNWAGAGEVKSVCSTEQLVFLRLKDDAQLFNRQGKALLSSSMRKQLKGLERAWLTADEQSPAGKATRPLAVFSIASRSAADDDAERFYALTASGRWAQLPVSQRAELLWSTSRDPLELAGPVMLRTVDGTGVLDAQGRWLLKPERNRDFYPVPGGWLGQQVPRSQFDQLWNAHGQKVELSQSVDIHVVARGVNWLESGGRWQLLDAQQARLHRLDGLDGLQLRRIVAGQVIMSQAVTDDGHVHTLQALYSPRGQRLSPWLRVDYLQPIVDGKNVLHGWVGTRADEAAGTFSMLLSRDGKPVTRWLPMSMKPLEGQALVVYSNGEGNGLMTPQGKVQLPALHAGITEAENGWLSIDEGEWNGLLDAEGRWLAVVPYSYDFDQLAKHNVLPLDSSYGGVGAMDLNGRVLRQVQAPAQELGAAALPPMHWQVTPSPLPAQAQFPINDAQPMNWFVHGYQQNASVRDMKGEIRLKATAQDAVLSLLPSHLVRTIEARESGDHATAELLDAGGRHVATFDTARLIANREARLMLKRVQQLPSDHPLARSSAQEQMAFDLGVRKVVVAEATPAQAMQISLVNETDGKVLGPSFDAMGLFKESRATVSYMGNLGVVDVQGRLVVQSAWRCGVTPVLLDGDGEITWPPRLRGQAGQDCPQP